MQNAGTLRIYATSLIDEGYLSFIAALEPPLQYNDEGSLPQPDLMEQTSESFLQRLLLVV